MRFTVRHQTVYTYDAPVTASFGQLHQLPGDQDGQRCGEAAVTIEPTPTLVSERVDYFGNRVVTCVIREPHNQLVLTSNSVVETAERAATVEAASRGVAVDGPWTGFRDRIKTGDLTGVEFALDSPLILRSRALAAYAEPSFGPDRSVLDAVTDLAARIHREFEFDPKATEVDTPVDEVLRLRRGVCQDFAHVMVGALRSLGLPACYVSGYLETDPPPGRPRLVGADRTHAWVGLYLGQGHWFGIDPTNNQPAGPRYITTARGRDYGDVPPMKGVIFTDAQRPKLSVSVDVIRS